MAPKGVLKRPASRPGPCSTACGAEAAVPAYEQSCTKVARTALSTIREDSRCSISSIPHGEAPDVSDTSLRLWALKRLGQTEAALRESEIACQSVTLRAAVAEERASAAQHLSMTAERAEASAQEHAQRLTSRVEAAEARARSAEHRAAHAEGQVEMLRDINERMPGMFRTAVVAVMQRSQSRAASDPIKLEVTDQTNPLPKP